MAEALVHILRKTAVLSDALTQECGSIAAITPVQGMRCVKGFYVRRFANNVNRRMKKALYGSLVRKSRREPEQLTDLTGLSGFAARISSGSCGTPGFTLTGSRICVSTA